MRQSLHVAGWTETSAGGGGGGGIVRAIAPVVVVVVALLVAVSVALAQVRETVLLTSPDVREAQVRQSVAESNYRTAQLARDTKIVNVQAADLAAWQPWVDGAGRLALVVLLGAVSLAIVGVLVGVGLLFRRHLSLPTVDGRVPIVGLDRELSREALFRYQELAGSRRASLSWSPVPGALSNGEGSSGNGRTRMAEVVTLHPEAPES